VQEIALVDGKVGKMQSLVELLHSIVGCAILDANDTSGIDGNDATDTGARRSGRTGRGAP
jgi:hypothetical protein